MICGYCKCPIGTPLPDFLIFGSPVEEQDEIKCPECGESLTFIHSLRFDDKTERIGLCKKCGKAIRGEEYGWKLLD